VIETLAVIDAPHFYAGLVLWDDRVASGNVDVAAAKELRANIAEEYTRYGLK